MIKENQTILNKINLLTDIVIIFISMITSYIFRFAFFEYQGEYLKFDSYFLLAVFLIPLNAAVYLLYNLYDPMRTTKFIRDCVQIIKANIILLSLSLSALFIFRIIHISRLVLFIFFFTNIIFSIIKREMLRLFLHKIRGSGLNLKHILIVGTGEIASEYLKVINSNKNYGYNYMGYVSNRNDFKGNKLGDYSDLSNVLSTYKLDEVICALDISDAKYLENIVSDCEKSGTKLSIIPFCYKYIPSQPYIDQIGNLPLINLRRIPVENLFNAFLKRSFDVIFSSILIVLTSPIMILTALIIKFTSKGSVIFKQERVGLNKKTFTMYKFRSMKINNEENTGWSKDVDNRKTRFGSFIRKFSIDELPQFFNVLKGDMSLVGPRPELPHFVNEFKEEIPLYMVKHQVKPGITGLAQINGFRGDTSIKRRIEFDIEYIENWNILMDISIVFKTAFKGLKNNEKINDYHVLVQ